MFCPHCGNEISENVQFCRYCGGSLRQENASAQTDVAASVKPVRKKRAIIIVVIILVLLAAGGAAYVLWHDGVSPQPEKAGIKIGNTAANLNNGGEMAEQGEYLYYSNGTNLVKAKEVNKDEQVLYNGQVSCINVMENWVYFVTYGKDDNDASIYRVKTDGTQASCIYTRGDLYEVCEKMVVVEDKIYMFPGMAGRNIYTMNLDGSGMEVFRGGGYCCLQDIDEDVLYFTDEENERAPLQQIKLDGTEGKIVCENFAKKAGTPEIMSQGKSYGIRQLSEDGDHMLCSYDVRSGEKKELCTVASANSGCAGSINIKDNWVYYRKTSSEAGEGEFYCAAKVKTDGTEDTVLTLIEDPFARFFATEKGCYLLDFSLAGATEETPEAEYVWKKLK